MMYVMSRMWVVPLQKLNPGVVFAYGCYESVYQTEAEQMHMVFRRH